jgi:hypothetical protein
MATSQGKWKKGRGKLGFFEPLLGTWEAEEDSPAGLVHCTRTFTRVLGNKYVQLSALWKTQQGDYKELAYFGVQENGAVGFWSFTSDGKQSTGRAANVTDIHPQAIGFEAQMPAGLARMAYWPDEGRGFHFAVEAKNKQGWKRFTHHHYLPLYQ